MPTKNVDKLDPAQCRGARGLLNMTQPELARAAGLGLSTIVDFERKRRAVSPEAIAAIRSTVTCTVCSSYFGDLECALLVGMRARDREHPWLPSIFDARRCFT